jgi:hypothetical protein
MPGVLLPTMLNVWAPCLRAQRSILLTKATEDARFQDIVFGKPSAPKEMYEGIARNARRCCTDLFSSPSMASQQLLGVHHLQAMRLLSS